MARIHFGSRNQPIRVDLLPNEPAPLGTVRTLELDDETNPGLAEDIAAHGDRYAWDGTTFTRDGQALALAAEGSLGRVAKLYAAVLVEFRDIADGTKTLAASDAIPTLRKICGSIVVLDRMLRR